MTTPNDDNLIAITIPALGELTLPISRRIQRYSDSAYIVRLPAGSGLPCELCVPRPQRFAQYAGFIVRPWEPGWPEQRPTVTVACREHRSALESGYA